MSSSALYNILALWDTIMGYNLPRIVRTIFVVISDVICHHHDVSVILTSLSQFQEAVIPSPAFLRLRELVNGRPGKIFKQPHQTLRSAVVVVSCTTLTLATVPKWVSKL